MKRHGKLLSLVLAVVMAAALLLSASGLEIFIIASSDEYEKYATSAKYLEAIDVLQGYDDGELHLDAPILRYQAALFFGRVVTGVTNDADWGEGPSATFTDVPQYGNVIDMIAGLDIIRGYGNGKFGYNDGIRYQDMCAMWIRALGYETEEMVAAYPMSYVLKAEELGIGLDNVMPADYLNRGQVAQMLYDALVTPISATADDTMATIVKILIERNGGTVPGVAVEEDTYLERNFDVSSQMYFQIVATENYRSSSTLPNAEEGYFKAYPMQLVDGNWQLVAEEWIFPIDGEETKDISEGDLIGKVVSIVFDDKEPTPEKLVDEEMAVIHAEVATSFVYENLGELSYVQFNEDGDVLTLGPKTVKFDGELDPKFVIYTDDANFAVVSPTLDTARQMMEENTYFHIEATDFDSDGEFDILVLVPYTFGQYQARTYKDKTYHMVGQYSETAVYDVTLSAQKTNDNKTHFIEKFLVSGATAVSTSNYKPGDTNVFVSESASAHSLNATLTGKSVHSGDFMLYNYNAITGELYVAENLGTYQVGTLSGVRTAAQTYVIDGSAMSVGMPGAIVSDALLTEEGFAETVDLAKSIIANFEKGNANIKYLEYDAKLVYVEAYGASDVVVGSDYVLVDVEATLEACLDADEDAWDLSFDGDAVVVKVLDPVTGTLSDAKVEAVTVADGSVVEFRNANDKRVFGNWADMTAYNTFKANGVLYAFVDEDEDGELELLAYGTEDFNVLGAPVKVVRDGNGDPVLADGLMQTVPVAFSYNKSNEFIAENAVGLLTDRITTNANTVSTVIGQDGYILVTGELGTNVESKPNALYLSPAAMVLEANDNQLTIFDPAGLVAIQADDAEVDNVFGDNVLSIWNTGSTGTADGYAFYMMLQNSMYNGSSAMLDDNGDIIETEDGEKLYQHEYRNLYNLLTGKSETVSLITTSMEAPATAVINSVEGVIRYNAEDYVADITTFGDVFVENGDYRYGGFSWLAAKDRINFATQAKDIDGNGIISADERGQSLSINSDEDLVYNTLSNLKVTFIDLDAGADVDSSEYSFQDAYVFYQATDSNRANYAAVTLQDREEGVDYASGTFPVKRHYVSRTDVTDVIANGAISNLSAGKNGLISSTGFFRWNGWSDYLIPAVDENGETIWSYAGSLRVKVTYYAYINYDEDNMAVDAVVVRVGQIVGEVATTDVVPEVQDEPIGNPNMP